MSRMTFNTLSLNLYLSGYTFLLLKQVDKFVHQQSKLCSLFWLNWKNITTNPTSLFVPFSKLKKKRKPIKKNGLLTSANVLEKTLDSPLDCRKIQPVHPKGDQSWVFIGRTDVEAETPILWPPHVKS